MPSHELINPFSIETGSLAVEKIIDRKDELERIETALQPSQSVLVVGENGVGKTCMLRKLRHKLTVENGGPLFVQLDVPSLARGATHFLQAVVDHIFDAVWVDVFRAPLKARLSILLGDADVPKSVKKAKFKQYLELFQLSRQKAVGIANGKNKGVGLSMLASANLAETSTTTRTYGELTPNDFLALAGELMAFLRESDVRQVVVFGDEANHIKPETELDIIRYNVEAFSAHHVQFILTMRRDVYDATPKINEIFSCVSELAPFSHHDHVQELLTHYSSCTDCNETHVPFTPDAAWKIHQITGGMPRDVQALCLAAWDCARGAGREEVTSADLDRAMFSLYKLVPIARR